MKKIKLFLFVIIVWTVALLPLSAQPGSTFPTNYVSLRDSVITYRAVLLTPGGELPFSLTIALKNNSIIAEIANGHEVINLSSDNYWFEGHGWLDLKFPVFNSEIILPWPPDTNKIDGYWRDNSRPGNYLLDFHAIQNENYRFVKNPLPAKANISGRYDAVFKDESSSDSTVAIFEQKENHLTGTFLTTTGDYRFLEGEVSADSFYLSAFDGSHAFLFKGKINDDGSLDGGYWSGKHYHANFTATKNINAKLPDPKKFTYLKDGYSKIEFSFPDENGKLISLEDERFKNKVVVIQITGTWCPNCMDETSYMSEVEEKFKNKELAIVALSFERQPDPQNFKINIDRLKNYFGIDYLYLNAGLPKNASDALPMLNRVMGFPTTIILNKKQEVAEIYTGFNGPATGQLFLDYQKDFEELIDALLRE